MRRPSDVVAALERVPVAVFMISAGGVIDWLNAAAIELVGDVTGRRYTALVAPESEHVARESFTRKLLGAGASEEQAVLMRPDGSRLIVEVSTVALESQGRITGVFGIVTPERALPRLRAEHELTPRQAEVLRHLASGQSTDRIAEALSLSRDTVRNHIRDLLKRLGAHSRLEAVLVARERGLI